MNIPTSDLCDKYRDEIKVFPAGFTNFGGKKFLSAPVKTMRSPCDLMGTVALMKSPGEGRVLVLDADNAGYYAIFGEQIAKIAMTTGWAGIIVNGYIRDSYEIASLDFGVWALGTCPRRPWEEKPSEEDALITIGDASIATGNYIYADPDGIIVADRQFAAPS